MAHVATVVFNITFDAFLARIFLGHRGKMYFTKIQHAHLDIFQENNMDPC
jgi:hypothetical protein